MVYVLWLPPVRWWGATHEWESGILWPSQVEAGHRVAITVCGRILPENAGGGAGLQKSKTG